MSGKPGKSGIRPLFGKAMTPNQREKRYRDRLAARGAKAWRHSGKTCERMATGWTKGKGGRGRSTAFFVIGQTCSFAGNSRATAMAVPIGRVGTRCPPRKLLPTCLPIERGASSKRHKWKRNEGGLLTCRVNCRERLHLRPDRRARRRASLCYRPRLSAH
jgi:hypothetical protein